MSFNDYFLKEKIALRALAKEAAERNPSLIPFFGTPGADPDVERLLEGFSFLAGRLREKIDDDLPEITHGLFGQLWPNFLRPFPAASIIQYHPTENTTGSTIVPRGTFVDSIPVDGNACRFQTVYDTEILPLRVADFNLLERNGTAILAVRFAILKGGLRTLRLSRLRVFFTGEDSIPHTLYFHLTHRLKEVRFVIKSNGLDGSFHENVTAVMPPSRVTPAGFEENEGMLPYPETLAPGYRILQEYFCFPEKFLFVDITGLEQGLDSDAGQRFADTEEFELHFVLPALPERYEELKAEHWKLFCTPVVNIFPFETAPQEAVQGQFKNKVIPDASRPGVFAVYSVEGVSGWGDEGKSVSLAGNTGGWSMYGEKRMSCRVHVRPTLDRENVETYLEVIGMGDARPLLRLQLLCTNGMLPKRLGVGDICMKADSPGGSNSTPFKNILPVSVPLPSPHNDDLLWKLLSNMRLTMFALTDVPSFRAIIATYAFRAVTDHVEAGRLDKCLNSIIAITSPSTDRMFNGIPRRGGRTTITMDQSFFSREGAMHLFGAVLNEFLATYATAGGFHQLIIREASRGEEYVWPARLGSLVGL